MLVSFGNPGSGSASDAVSGSSGNGAAGGSDEATQRFLKKFLELVESFLEELTGNQGTGSGDEAEKAAVKSDPSAGKAADDEGQAADGLPTKVVLGNDPPTEEATDVQV